MSSHPQGTIWVARDWFLYVSDADRYDDLLSITSSMIVSPMGPWRVRSNQQEWCGRILAHASHQKRTGCGPGGISFWPTPSSKLALALKGVLSARNEPFVALDHLLDTQGFLTIANGYEELKTGSFPVSDLASAVADINDRLIEEIGTLPFIDPRAERLAERLRCSKTAHLSISQHAHEIGISPDHLRHLFVQSFGLRATQYLTWLKIHTAVRYAASRTSPEPSVTAAAFAAGFADNAHFSNTTRRLFSTRPSDLKNKDFAFVAVEPLAQQGCTCGH